MSFRVASKNTKEDPDYDPPFGVEVDEETGIAEREQSLALLFENIEPGYSASARKVFYSDDDYTGYESLELYVHGNDEIDPGSLVFVRIGADTANYYEYSFEVSPGWLQRAGAAQSASRCRSRRSPISSSRRTRRSTSRRSRATRSA